MTRHPCQYALWFPTRQFSSRWLRRRVSDRISLPGVGTASWRWHRETGKKNSCFSTSGSCLRCQNRGQQDVACLSDLTPRACLQGKHSPVRMSVLDKLKPYMAAGLHGSEWPAAAAIAGMRAALEGAAAFTRAESAGPALAAHLTSLITRPDPAREQQVLTILGTMVFPIFHIYSSTAEAAEKTRTASETAYRRFRPARSQPSCSTSYSMASFAR